MLEVYGMGIWRFVPVKWRYWWIHAVEEISCLEDVSIEYPSAVFKDITEDIRDMKCGLKKKLCQKS